MYMGYGLLLNSNKWITLSNKKLEDVRICLFVVLMRIQNLSKTTDNHLFPNCYHWYPEESRSG